ncbi:fumarylacetoacetate hydrolase family protein [Salinivibrio costicola]|uniref:Fumarylacetoacetate hydrolase family protein n=1 Tax=Salinivibrio costicola TaxID=51367 RepID=A0ABX6K9G5_SALCS|nr:fumarylacetoacetate hydrolase family protein [Salinivibrio costicola]QIR07877.1 fumarylacetoacetate hydrolase family protein [Salinivibrio costicola]
MDYQHQWINGNVITLPVGQVYCVGRNYAAHAAELNNPLPEQSVIFIKPPSAIQPLGHALTLAEKFAPVHFETELAVLITQPLYEATPSEVQSGLGAMALGLDLTRRDQQSYLKAKGLPWERAKAFAGSALITPFVATPKNWDDVFFSLAINGEIRQQGHTAHMLTSVVPLIAHMSDTFPLRPGDVVFTGTPEGVGPLANGDELTLRLGECDLGETRVVYASSSVDNHGNNAAR